MVGETYKAVGNQGKNEFRKNIQSYGSNTPFFRAIYYAFKEKSERKPEGSSVILLDAMSGPGRLGIDLYEKYSSKPRKVPMKVIFNDVRLEPLQKIMEERNMDFSTVLSDVRGVHNSLPKGGELPDIAAVRYGLKEFQKSEIPFALEALRDSIKDNGRLIIADMTAYTVEGQKGVIQVHQAKKEFEGRLKEDGLLHIPTEGEWLEIVRGAGFVVESLRSGMTSDVVTKQWGANQFLENEERITAEMNKLIISVAKSNPTFKDEFQVTWDGSEVSVKYPIMVLWATKK